MALKKEHLVVVNFFNCCPMGTSSIHLVDTSETPSTRYILGHVHLSTEVQFRSLCPEIQLNVTFESI